MILKRLENSTINHSLRSLGVISKPGRGGTRALPWVVSRKGAIRLATIMKVPTAMDAADVFVDVFDEILGQVFQGKKMIQVSNPSRISPDVEQLNQAKKVRSKIGDPRKPPTRTSQSYFPARQSSPPKPERSASQKVRLESSDQRQPLTRRSRSYFLSRKSSPPKALRDRRVRKYDQRLAIRCGYGRGRCG